MIGLEHHEETRMATIPNNTSCSFVHKRCYNIEQLTNAINDILFKVFFHHQERIKSDKNQLKTRYFQSFSILFVKSKNRRVLTV